MPPQRVRAITTCLRYDAMRGYAMQLTCAALLLPLVSAIAIKVSDGYVLNTIPAGFASFTMDYHPSSQGGSP